MLPTKFHFIWPSGFRGEDFQKSNNLAQLFQRRFLEINQSEIRIACGSHVCYGSGRNQQSLQKTVHRCFISSFDSFGQAVSEERRFKKKWPIRNKNCLWRPCLYTDLDEMSNLYREPSIDASYKVLVDLAQLFQRRSFFKIGQSETRIACGGHVC